MRRNWISEKSYVHVWIRCNLLMRMGDLVPLAECGRRGRRRHDPFSCSYSCLFKYLSICLVLNLLVCLFVLKQNRYPNEEGRD